MSLRHTDKVAAAVSYLDQRIKEADSNFELPLAAYHNIFFFADIVHLNSYSRPILLEDWQAYEAGPTGYRLSDTIGMEIEYDWDCLSESDKEEIERALDIYLMYLGPHSNLANIVKMHPAYTAAIEKGPSTLIKIENMVHSTTPLEKKEELIANVLAFYESRHRNA